jgi:tetratricopeptide (TPR) repeat protein
VPDVAITLNSLAGQYQAQSRFADAEPLYKRALGIMEKTLGPDHPDVAITLNNLANGYQARLRFADAEPLYKRALAIQEKGLGRDHPFVAGSRNNLASLYRFQGRYADALPLVRTAAENGSENLPIHLAILTGAAAQSLIKNIEGIDEGFQVVQRAVSSAASNAINQLSARFATGKDELARIVRKDQDLSLENELLDKRLVEFISKEPAKRDVSKEEQSEVACERLLPKNNRYKKHFINSFLTSLRSQSPYHCQLGTPKRY